MDEIKKKEDYVPRDHKQSRFDKRLIHKIVKEVEQGLPRKEAHRIYGFGKASLDTWMRRYGSPEYRENIKRRTYTNLQKRTIVTAIEQSRMSIKEAQIAYNIKSEFAIRRLSAGIYLTLRRAYPVSKHIILEVINQPLDCVIYFVLFWYYDARVRCLHRTARHTAKCLLYYT